MFDPNQNAPVFHHIPMIVWLLCGLLLLPELYFQIAEAGLLPGGRVLRQQWIGQLALWGEPIMADWAAGRAGNNYRFLSYPLVDGSFLNTVFSTVFVLAFGKFVSVAFEPLSLLAVFVGASIVGALLFLLLMGTDAILIGGMVGAYGLIGAFTWIRWQGLREAGEPVGPAFLIIGFLGGLNLFFWLFMGAGLSWVAELSAAAVGFGLSFLVGPGSAQRIRDWRARLRAR